MTGAVSKQLTIRTVTAADLPIVVALLEERDGRRLDAGLVHTALYGLDPAQIAGWIALVGEEPAGVTMLYLRDLQWGEETIRAGYWAHLFVPERHRRLMVYPRLVVAMQRGIDAIGVDAILTAMRRQNVAAGHVRLGFTKLGDLPVLFKPLRPFRLVARYRRFPLRLHRLLGAGDAPYGRYLELRSARAPADIRIRAMDAVDAPVATLVSLLNGSRDGHIGQRWTPETLERRLAGTIDGIPYRVLLAERSSRPAGAAIYRVAARDGVDAGVIMEVAVTEVDSDVLPGLVSETERLLRAEGADTTLFLDGQGDHVRAGLLRSGHRTSSERYSMLVWPDTLVNGGQRAADLGDWRFSFLDHDAF